MELKELTWEELEELEQEVHNLEEVNKFSSLPRKIKIHEEMYRRLRYQKKPEEERYLEYVTKKLVFNLIHYGTFLKMEYQKDDQLAIVSLEKALRYDRNNPIAAYRLGFLFYKHHNFEEALHYFQKATINQEYYPSTRYQLDQKQLINAHLYLTNSALYIAKDTHEKLKKLVSTNAHPLPNYEFSSLYPSLEENEQYLENNAFYKICPEGISTCSKRECEELITQEKLDTIILYFGDRRINIFFNGDTVELNQRQGDIIRYLLTKTNINHPATRISLRHLFEHSFIDEEVRPNTFIRTISRIKGKLDSCGIPDVIETERYRNETGYYYNQEFPFVVLVRVEEEMGFISS
ncbi:hypothetical protein [Bacillus massilinigeriensis]|uniref:hypothetical protein n=1 Tax=Bacillus massilionigeriensis TaxID=1805475 RepID=UPI00096B2F0A|nr:hypothetical protein [Bacillus massilionigeriensis]